MKEELITFKEDEVSNQFDFFEVSKCKFEIYTAILAFPYVWIIFHFYQFFKIFKNLELNTKVSTMAILIFDIVITCLVSRSDYAAAILMCIILNFLFLLKDKQLPVKWLNITVMLLFFAINLPLLILSAIPQLILTVISHCINKSICKSNNKDLNFLMHIIYIIFIGLCLTGIIAAIVIIGAAIAFRIG